MLKQPGVGDPRFLGAGRAAARDHGRPEAEERLAVRLMASLAVTDDRRIIDGAGAARYLATVRPRLERPDGAARSSRCLVSWRMSNMGSTATESPDASTAVWLADHG